VVPAPAARLVQEKLVTLPDLSPPAIAQVTRETIEVPQLKPTIAAPAPKMGNLTSARIEASVETNANSVRAAGFGASASPAAASSGPAQVALGEFGSARTAGSSANTTQVRSSGFAQEKAAATATASGTLSRSGFADLKTVKPEAAAAPGAAPKGLDNAVEILSKPKPEYSAEARQLRIEGEVLLEVLFQASGKARPMRVVRGLGHGLDEAAEVAVERITFRPARRNNIAVDAAAVVHIVFQLAY
jgi:TonB family protein